MVAAWEVTRLYRIQFNPPKKKEVNFSLRSNDLGQQMAAKPRLVRTSLESTLRRDTKKLGTKLLIS